jgi:2,4-dienoyl-CoA reductase-like NADH-dependent reductase (Old Yellow Enzyme family)/nucleoside-diphosphate-sugar epimerase
MGFNQVQRSCSCSRSGSSRPSEAMSGARDPRRTGSTRLLKSEDKIARQCPTAPTRPDSAATTSTASTAPPTSTLGCDPVITAKPARAEQQGNDREIVLLTGAAGFVGRYVLNELLSQISGRIRSVQDDCQDIYEGNACKYDQIIAVDMCSPELIASIVAYSPFVLPLQLDLRKLLSSNSVESRIMEGLLPTITTVIHIAGIVDTRENEATKKLLQEVNVDVVRSMVQLSSRLGVKRFVHMSSGATRILRRSTISSVPFYFRWFCRNSLFSNLDASTYARSKLDGERHVLQSVSSSNGVDGTMKACVLRPQGVWGAGDPLSTESIMSWPSWMPHLMIGDPTNPMIFCRADNLAKFVMVADAGLANNPHDISGRGFDVADSQLSSLLKIHWRLLKYKKCVSALCSPILPRPLLSLTWMMLESLGFASGHTADGRTVYTFILPCCIVFLMIMIGELLDWLSAYTLSVQYVRIMSANNVAYCMREVVTVPTLAGYQDDCVALFRGACKSANLHIPQVGNAFNRSYGDWLDKLDMGDSADLSILSKDYLKNHFTKYLLRVPSSSVYELSLSKSLSVGPIVLRNRVIKAATFESMCDSSTGVPTEQLIKYHARQASGGVGMTVVAYACVSVDGRSFPTQIDLTSDKDTASMTQSMLRKLCQSVHQNGARCCLQLTHAGAFADSRCNGSHPAVGPSAILNPLTLQYSRSLENDPDACDRICADFVRAVDICRDVGFDAVEVHLGHGYLLSQFLSRRTNSKFARDPHRRLEFPLRVLKAVIRSAHSLDAPNVRCLAVLAKFNVSELNEEDLPVSDVRLFASAFYQAGADLLVPSGGHVMVNGLHMLRGGRPIVAMAAAQRNFLKKWIITLFGEYVIAQEQYREAFFRERAVSALLGHVPLHKVCLVGGVHDLTTAEDAICLSGFGAVQLGRVLLADPDWCIKVGVHKSQKVHDHVRACDNSNECIVGSTMALTPLRCVKHSKVDW